MKATYNKSKIMRNAWYLKRANASMSFSACLKKAWRNEKLAILTAKIENRPTEQPKATEYRPQLLTVTAGPTTETNGNRGRTARPPSTLITEIDK